MIEDRQVHCSSRTEWFSIMSVGAQKFNSSLARNLNVNFGFPKFVELLNKVFGVKACRIDSLVRGWVHVRI